MASKAKAVMLAGKLWQSLEETRGARKRDYSKGMTVRWWALFFDEEAYTTWRTIRVGERAGTWIRERDYRKPPGRIVAVYRPVEGYIAPTEADE
jgi:hypothetical protein